MAPKLKIDKWGRSRVINGLERVYDRYKTMKPTHTRFPHAVENFVQNTKISLRNPKCRAFVRRTQDQGGVIRDVRRTKDKVIYKYKSLQDTARTSDLYSLQSAPRLKGYPLSYRCATAALPLRLVKIDLSTEGLRRGYFRTSDVIKAKHLMLLTYDLIL